MTISRLRMTASAVGMLTAALAGSPVRADTAVPSVSVDDIREAARIALAQGVQWFRQRSEKDPDGWLVPPGRVRRQIGTTNVIVHYRKVLWDKPIYEYKTVTTFVQVSPGEPPRKVTREQPIRQIGTEKQERTVYDPHGPIERLEVYPVYERGGNVFWRFSNVGDAAFATYALRCAGVPDTDPVIERMLANLEGYVQQYGAPDQTWNLTWLTVVFAATPGPEAETRTRDLAGRILDGQITEGPARGLWGPMCLHPRHLAVLLRDFLVLNADMKRKELRAQGKNAKAAQHAMQEATQDLSGFKDMVDGVSRLALRFGSVEQSFVVDPNTDPTVEFSGSSHFFYNQTAADLESTWAALLALAAAAEHGRLPAESARPVYRSAVLAAATRGAKSVPPETATAVLARAANALAALQTSDGRWNECNVHQPVKDFDAFGHVLPVPVDPKSFPPLVSPVTAASDAEGLGAMDSVGRAVGMARLLGAFRQPYLSGVAGRARAVRALIASVPAVAAANVFTNSANFDLLMALARPLAATVDGADDAEADFELTRMLVLAGRADGAWYVPEARAYVPSSTRARLEALKPLADRLGQRGREVGDPQKAHLWAPNAILRGDPERSPILRDAEAFATAAAVIYLASRMPEPATAVAGVSADASLPALRKEYARHLLGRVLMPAPGPEAATNTHASAPAAVTAGTSNAVPRPPDLLSPADLDVPSLPDKPADTTPKPDETL